MHAAQGASRHMHVDGGACHHHGVDAIITSASTQLIQGVFQLVSLAGVPYLALDPAHSSHYAHHPCISRNMLHHPHALASRPQDCLRLSDMLSLQLIKRPTSSLLRMRLQRVGVLQMAGCVLVTDDRLTACLSSTCWPGHTKVPCHCRPHVLIRSDQQPDHTGSQCCNCQAADAQSTFSAVYLLRHSAWPAGEGQ